MASTVEIGRWGKVVIQWVSPHATGGGDSMPLPEIDGFAVWKRFNERLDGEGGERISVDKHSVRAALDYARDWLAKHWDEFVAGIPEAAKGLTHEQQAHLLKANLDIHKEDVAEKRVKAWKEETAARSLSIQERKRAQAEAAAAEERRLAQGR